MKKIWGLTMAVLLVAFSMQPMVLAEPITDSGALIEVGNKICPVSGEKVGQMGDPVQVEYNGKLYNLCCKMCEKNFNKDPEKYSKIAEAHVNIETESKDMMYHGQKGSGEDHGMHGMHAEGAEHGHSH